MTLKLGIELIEYLKITMNFSSPTIRAISEFTFRRLVVEGLVVDIKPGPINGDVSNRRGFTIEVGGEVNLRRVRRAIGLIDSTEGPNIVDGFGVKTSGLRRRSASVSVKISS